MNLPLLSFIKTFLQEHQCKIIDESNDHLTVTLTETLDNALMNRPFYWHYIKSTGQQGEPMTITLTTNPNNTTNKCEFVHFGSPRFQQILNFLHEHEKFIKLYEVINTSHKTLLFHWLLIIIKLTYKCLLINVK